MPKKLKNETLKLAPGELEILELLWTQGSVNLGQTSNGSTNAVGTSHRRRCIPGSIGWWTKELCADLPNIRQRMKPLFPESRFPVAIVNSSRCSADKISFR